MHPIPAGWKLVPIEPTPEMLEAARRAPQPAVMVDSRSAAENLQHKAAYAAMLGAVTGSPASVAPGDAQDERQAFEAWFTRNDETKDMADRSVRRDACGEYYLMQTYTAWEIWRAARASVAAPAAGDALDFLLLTQALQELRQAFVIAVGDKSPFARMALEKADAALAAAQRKGDA